jgi:hypothetical protein
MAAQHMQRQIAITEPKPIRPAKRGQGFHKSPAFIRAPPTKLRIVQPSQGVEQGIRIGADREAVMFKIIARIRDDQQFLWRQNARQAKREFRPTNAAGQRDDH